MKIESLESRKLLSAYTNYSYEQSVSQESIVTADWNHDGKIGFATSSYSGQWVKVSYKAYKAYNISSQVRYNTLTIPFDYGVDHVATGDLNGDLLPDLVVSSFDKSSFAVYLNQKNGFVFNKWYDVDGINSVSLGDFDRDGSLDIACAKSYQTGLTTFFGLGNGKFSDATTLATTNQLDAVAIGDVVGGNGRDIFAIDHFKNQMIIFKYEGGTSFSQYAVVPTGSGPADIAVGDVIGDSKLDIITANYQDDNISVFDGNSPTFEITRGTGFKSGPTSVFAADYDGDGDQDIAVACAHNDTINKFFHNGNDLSTGTFFSIAKPTPSTWDPNAVDSPVPRRIVAARYNQDNIDDIFICNDGASYVTVSTLNLRPVYGPFIKNDPPIRFSLFN